MNDEVDWKDIANFTFISSTSIPTTNANLNQQFTSTLSNPGNNITPLTAYAYFNDPSTNGAYYLQANSLQPQLNPFPQQPSVTFENFDNPFNSSQPSGYQYNPLIMMSQPADPNGYFQQESTIGSQDVTITNSFHNQQHLFTPSPQPQEIFSSTLNNSFFGAQPPASTFNFNPNFTGLPYHFTRPESTINQIPQLQRFSNINGTLNDVSFFPIPKSIPLQWSFAPKQLNGATDMVNQANSSNAEVKQNYLLRIEQVTLINAIPIDSTNVAREPPDQTSTSIQHRYIADSEGLTILSQVGENKPQVIKIDMECIKQMLTNNSCFYIQQFMNGPTGIVKKEATSDMQTDGGSLRTDIVEMDNQLSETTEVIQILEPKELPAEKDDEDIHTQSERDLLEFEGKGNEGVSGRLLNENETDSEPKPRTNS